MPKNIIDHFENDPNDDPWPAQTKLEGMQSEYREKLARLKTLDKMEKRSVSDEKEFDTLVADMEILGKKIDRQHMVVEGEKQVLFDEGSYDDDNIQTRAMSHKTVRARTGQNISYRGLWGANSLSNDGFGSFGQWLNVVASNRYHDKLVTRTQNIATPSDGGFLTPTSYAAAIVDLALEKSLLWKNAVVYPMASGVLKVPAISDTDHSSSRGGIVALWKSESAELTLDTILLRQLEFKARKLSLLIKCSREFLDDAQASEQFVRNVMASEIAWQLDHVFLNSGTGAGTPLSILNSGATISVSEEEGQASGSFLWENALSMVKAFNPSASESGIWIFSPSLKGDIYSMSQSVGTGGSSVHPDPSQVKERGLSLLGFPVKFSEHCNVAGAKGDAFLVNPKGYAIALRQDIRLEASSHVAFTTDEVVFKATLRCDAMPISAEKMTLSDGSTEVSDFVTLDER